MVSARDVVLAVRRIADCCLAADFCIAAELYDEAVFGDVAVPVAFAIAAPWVSIAGDVDALEAEGVAVSGSGLVELRVPGGPS